uniref:Uncharacterized protein n=1 Tax=Anguilla anguilla TaxID=7936 RepID=A0A0E9WW72_ANGAN
MTHYLVFVFSLLCQQLLQCTSTNSEASEHFPLKGRPRTFSIKVI